MKNLDVESEIGELRPEYKRSDFGEFTRGAVTQVEFAERVALLLACIGQDEKITFRSRSEGNYRDQPVAGDWTYEIGHSDNQITLSHWLGGWDSISERLSNPPCVFTAEDNNTLISALTTGVKTLRVKVGNHNHK
jgi:hypothetical protein